MPDPQQLSDQDYDLVPVDEQPNFVSQIPAPQMASLGDAPVPKTGQTVQPVNVGSDLAAMPGKVASAVGDVTGVNDAYKAATGQMTPEEAQTFALGAIPALAAGPEAKVAEEVAPAVARGIRAFHGSPYDFNAFDLSKIGTGEGAQAYGHGLYFAENPSTARSYRDALTDLGPAPTNKTEEAQRLLLQANGDPQLAMAKAVSKYQSWPNPQKHLAKMQQAMDEAVTNPPKHPGKMYEVNINADPEHFLDWDKPLSEQHPVVQQALQSLDVGSSDPKAIDVQTQLNSLLSKKEMTKADAEKYSDLRSQLNALNPSGATLYRNLSDANEPLESAKSSGTRTATEKMRDAGIPGIKYLDQGSRGYTVQTTYKGQPYSDPVKFATREQADTWAAQKRDEGFGAEPTQTGTRNYVVFDPKTIDIVKKYGLAGLVAGGAVHFQTVPVDNEPDFGGQHADGGAVAGPQSSGFSDMSGIVDLTSAMAPNGIDTSDWRPSTNIEDDRGVSVLNKIGRNIMMNVTGEKNNWISDISNAITGRTPTPPDEVPFRARGGRISPLLPHGLTLEYAPAPMNRWGIYDKSGTQLSTGKTEEEAVANLSQKRAHGGRVEPANINHNPTAAQAKAGNYAHDHLHYQGLPLTIENAKGSIRRGVDRGGKAWACKLPAHYGYIKRTVAADSDHVDVYLGPHRKAPNVFVIDQVDADSRQYDEAKVMLGFSSLKQALASYCKAFSDGRGHERIGIITTMTMPEFKRWLERGNTTAPFAHPQSEARV